LSDFSWCACGATPQYQNQAILKLLKPSKIQQHLPNPINPTKTTENNTKTPMENSVLFILFFIV